MEKRKERKECGKKKKKREGRREEEERTRREEEEKRTRREGEERTRREGEERKGGRREESGLDIRRRRRGRGEEEVGEKKVRRKRGGRKESKEDNEGEKKTKKKKNGHSSATAPASQSLGFCLLLLAAFKGDAIAQPEFSRVEACLLLFHRLPHCSPSGRESVCAHTHTPNSCATCSLWRTTKAETPAGRDAGG